MNIFISYRRDDTRHLAGRIRDRLRTMPGIGTIFYDIDVIGPGENFRDRITGALQQRPVCIALIGDAWLGPRPTGGMSRIFDEDDSVRMEVFGMLSFGLRLLPVLADGATMPSPAQVPADLYDLLPLHAIAARHKDFESDMGTMLRALGLRSGPSRTAVLRRAILRAVLFTMLAMVGIVALAVVHDLVAHRPLEATLGGAGLVWLLILGMLSVAAALGFITGARART